MVGKSINQLEEATNCTYNIKAELKAFDDSKVGVKGLVESGILKIPRIFHIPKDEIIENSRSDTKLSLPIIDLKDIHANPPLRVEVIDQIRRASHEWGFFKVINHGIPVTVLDEMIDGIRRFHEQDANIRKEFYTRDGKKRVMYYSNGSRQLLSGKAINWRDTLSFIIPPGRLNPELLPPICRDIVIQYSQKITDLSFTIFELLSEALGLDPSYLKELNYVEGFAIVGHYYPPCPEPDLTIGTQKHIDNNFMTLLLEDQLGGLQVLHEDKWVNVPPVHGALVVNIGGLLQILTNDRFVSVYHRVLAQNIGPRISVASYFMPFKGAATKVGPIKELLSEENPPIYKDITIKEYSEHGLRIAKLKQCSSDIDTSKGKSHTEKVIEPIREKRVRKRPIWWEDYVTAKFKK